MKIGYTIIAISYNEERKRFEYKYSDRYDTYFQTFSRTMTHEQCKQSIEKKLISIHEKKEEEKMYDRSRYAGSYNLIEIGE